ncbi:MAG: hypothetical protein V1866_07135 [archaeon]
MEAAELTEQMIELIAEEIISKQELSNLNIEFVKEQILKMFSENGKTSRRVLSKYEHCEGRYDQFRRSKEHDEVIKSIRAKLRRVYGVFILDDYKKRYALLEELKKNDSLEMHNKILALHQSTKERLPYYSTVYPRIFQITGRPKKIVDLACGLNPISYPYLECSVKYLACDLADEDLKFVDAYFKAKSIRGATLRVDLIKDDVSEITKDSDICFLFKTLDTLEAAKRNISRELLKQIGSKFIAVSFATRSIGGGKAIRKERRSWFEKILAKNHWSFEIFELPNEVFYIIKR